MKFNQIIKKKKTLRLALDITFCVNPTFDHIIQDGVQIAAIPFQFLFIFIFELRFLFGRTITCYRKRKLGIIKFSKILKILSRVLKSSNICW